MVLRTGKANADQLRGTRQGHWGRKVIQAGVAEQMSLRTRTWAVCLVVLISSVAAAAARRPNVVFVLADQWRACATGYAGDPNVKTPNLDRHATVPANFMNAVSPC